MSFYRDEDAFAQFQMMQKVLSMFDGTPHMQRIIHAGIQREMEGDEDVYEFKWDSHQNDYPVHKKTYNEYLDMDSSNWAAAEYQVKETDAERKARLLLEMKKSKEKAEKKRLKKQRQKERKRLENEQNQDQEIKDITSQARVEDKQCNDKCKDKYLSGKDMAAAQYLKSSDDTSDELSNEENDDEELDLTSCFVTKAAQIAKRQMEQKPKQENKEKKKTPVKEPKSTQEKPKNEDRHFQKKDTATFSSKMEDNVKISTELAMIGNKFASSGDFSMAVKYFTDAIRYNPTEYRLFGNRAFCFEKNQEYEKSLNDAELSLGMCPGWVKGLFRKGRALAGLKRYEEAACAFKEVLKLDSSCTEATQELMRVQITQLMGYGFTREQSSNALIIHGTVDKALEVLSKLNKQPDMSQIAPVKTKQVANVTGVSPVLSAKVPPAAPPPPRDTSDTLPENKPLLHVQNVQSQTKPDVPSKSQNVAQAPELFPVWVGNLAFSVTEALIANLFNKVGAVYSIKHLPNRRCAFVNYTQQHYCEEAIQKYHGFELMDCKIAVRYPDRIPPGLNISRAAHKANHLQDENMGHNSYAVGSTGGRPIHPNYRGPYKY